MRQTIAQFLHRTADAVYSPPVPPPPSVEDVLTAADTMREAGESLARDLEELNDKPDPIEELIARLSRRH